MRLIAFITFVLILSACKSKVVQYPVNYEEEREKFMEFSQDRNKDILNEDNELILHYIDSLNQPFVRTSYGFWISNSAEATSEMAKGGDYVKYEYEVTDFDNQTIYSKEEIGIQEGVLGKQNLPRGLHVTLQLIEKGDSAIALYPSFLAYGGYGDQHKIGGNAPLIFKVKVLDIKKKDK